MKEVMILENYEGIKNFSEQTNGNRSVLFAFRNSMAFSRDDFLLFVL